MLYAAGFVFNYTSCCPGYDTKSSTKRVYCSYLKYSCQGEFVKHIVLIDFGKSAMLAFAGLICMMFF